MSVGTPALSNGTEHLAALREWLRSLLVRRPHGAPVSEAAYCELSADTDTLLGTQETSGDILPAWIE